MRVAGIILAKDLQDEQLCYSKAEDISHRLGI